MLSPISWMDTLRNWQSLNLEKDDVSKKMSQSYDSNAGRNILILIRTRFHHL